MAFLESATQFWSDWGLRICVLVSLAAYILRGLISGTRRRSASGGLSWWIGQWALRFILWFVYQLAEMSATSALGNLSLCGADADASGKEEEEQLLMAFWAPFLLLHLGGPDNMSAYDLEDNMLSLRKMMEMLLELLGVLYGIWNYIYRGHAHKLLFKASVIVLVEGTVRYGERAYTLWKTNLEKMQEQQSSKKTLAEPPAAAAGASNSSRSRSSSISRRAAAVESTITTYKQGRPLDDSDTLLLAQDLYEVWRRFLVDASVHRWSPWQHVSEKLLSLPWEKMCMVVEMELSLMYEVLYTKATVAHTWRGYLIRFMSPACSAAAAALFWLHLHRDRDRGGKVGASPSFVVITYLLLGTAFALDVVWLLRALGSTWTYAYLKKKLAPSPRRPWPWAWSWLHHQSLCAGSGWWRRLHRAVVYLDPLPRLFGIDDPVAYRRWSGTIGRYNLLDKCTVPRRPCRRWLATKLGLHEQDNNYLSELPPKVKRMVFERVQWILPTAGNGNPDPYTMENITTNWGHETIRRGAIVKLFEKEHVKNLPGLEFEQDVLVWHIGTCIFLSRKMVRNKIEKSSTAADHVTAIKAMSEYLMFLVAERRQMLPGLLLHSQVKDTSRTLQKIWDDYGRRGGPHEDDKGKLAQLLQGMRKKEDDRSKLETQDSKKLVLDATEIDGALTKGSTWEGKKEVALDEMLKLIFNVWVDKLVYAAVRCSRESHAKQLSRGGELTTVLWIVIQHAGPFRIGEKRKHDEKKPAVAKEEDTKHPIPSPYPPQGPKEEDTKHPIPSPYPPQGPQYAPAYPYPRPYPPQGPLYALPPYPYPSTLQGLQYALPPYPYPYPPEGPQYAPPPMAPAEDRPDEAQASQMLIPDVAKNWILRMPKILSCR